MMIGTISTILAATIINVAFPALMAEFHVRHDTLQWVAAGFLAATTATMLATAWLVETIGERATFAGTMGLFLAASLLATLSWSVESLIAARIVQGACAGILQPLAMIVLFRVYPVDERGRAMALYGFGIVLAPAIGPAIGGALLEAFGWRSIFLLTVAFCIAGLVLGMTTLPRHAGRTSSRFDWLVVSRETFREFVEMTAWTDITDGSFDELIGLRHRVHPVEGVQFLPDSILTEHGHALLKNFLER